MTATLTLTDWAAAGCSVTPVATDGSKRPGVAPWKPFQLHAAGTAQIDQWTRDKPGSGVGLVCGAVSGNLEMFEAEGRAVAAGLPARLRELLEAHGLADLWATVSTGYMEQTPAGGIHWLYRVDGPARRNLKLASRPATPDELAVDSDNKHLVLFETRGEGGFVVVASTGGNCHPSGRPWQQMIGSPGTIPTISLEQRDQLHAVTSLLDQLPTTPEPAERAMLPPTADGYIPGTRPGDAFNATADWDEILGHRGWTRMWKIGAGWGWRRPGKNSRSISATTGTSADGADRLYVFSSSTEFTTEIPYSKFAAITHLDHGGDYSAAAKALSRAGYGDPPSVQAPPIRRLTAVPAAADSDTPPPPVVAGRSPRHSDDGNALALIHTHGQILRFCPDRDRWLVWDGTRWQWQPKGGGRARELAKEVAQRLVAADGSKLWQVRSLSAPGISSTLTQAATAPQITVSIAALDADPWALGTPGGTVDLRTGELATPDPAQLLTRSTAVTPDPAADNEAWLAFLAVTFGGDQELIDYLQRLVGYSATGHVGPHVLPFAYGSGGNGKGVFLEALTGVLGDYATTAPNAFLMSRTFAPHETEIARLAGARMVLCSEVNESDKFDEAKVKQLTGGDTLTARFMRADHFTFAPSHHLWLLGNYKPAVTSGGRAFWRRCRLIPFLHEVPQETEVDDLQGKLIAEHGPALLAWIVAGAVGYAGRGLREPKSVIAATAEYAYDQDTVGRFVDEMCHLGPPLLKVPVRDLFGSYERWCGESGEVAVTAKRLTQELRSRFDADSIRSHGKRFYAGITLIEQAENRSFSEPKFDGGDDGPGTRGSS